MTSTHMDNIKAFEAKVKSKYRTKDIYSPTERIMKAKEILAAATQHINFGCKTAPENTTPRATNTYITITNNKRGCDSNGRCCKDCNLSLGWFKTFNNRVITTVGQYWNNKTGFLGKKRCKIPRRYRSTLCLTHSCETPTLKQGADTKLVRAVLEALDQLNV